MRELRLASEFPAHLPLTVGKKKSFAIEGNSGVLNLSLKICLHFCKHPRINDNSKSWKN